MSQQVIGGRFRLLSVLGSGGFGEVWRAFDERLGVEVAVKQVRLDPSATEAERAKRVEQAENEARSAAKLREHPNIVAVYDVVTASGEPWLVMRLVRGRTLAQEIRARGGLPAAEAGRIASGVLAALRAAHAAEIVHRDVKPANIMLSDDGTVLLTDFGIAKEHTGTTQAVLIGTLPYMSPERLNGKDLPAGDLFALGATMYEMTEGVSPFARSTATAIMSAVLLEQPAPPLHADHLAALILALLEKDPARRPDATTAARVLVEGTGTLLSDRTTIEAPLSGGRDVPPTIDDGAATGRRPSRRGLLLAGLGVAGVAALPVGFILGTRSGGTDDAKSPSGSASPSTSGSPSAPGASWRPVTPSGGGTAVPLAVAFAPAGTLLASAGADGIVRLWDAATGASTKTFAHRPVNPWTLPLEQITAFNSLFTAALSVTFRPDGAALAVANGDGTVSLWNIADGTETVLPYLDPRTWNRATGSVSFDPRGGVLAAAYDAPTIRLWEVAGRTNLAALTTDDTSWVSQVAFSPDGRTMATTSGNNNPGNTVSDGRLQLWDTASRTRIAALENVNSPLHALSFSPDGRTLANLRSDGRITLWDVGTRTAAKTLTGPASGVTCIAFGPGDTLAGGFKEGTVTLWDTRSGRSTKVLTTATNAPVTCIAISPDGKTLAATTRTLGIWRLGT
ncbi:serine/threonine protein kinase (plasmid) [Embleya sp. NBC_00888]|uniref:WD40 repeat domain-containing serine/threonine protein kinase n=1 Tax=Embleya sp. NBC_00888 TaxID=2975960 RepID=UPI002F90A473|nr:serine/threonine protein kinase [Embleya sp. NBC_00888]